MIRLVILLLVVLSLALVSAVPAFAQGPPDVAPPAPGPDTGLDMAEGASGKILPVGTEPGEP